MHHKMKYFVRLENLCKMKRFFISSQSQFPTKQTVLTQSMYTELLLSATKSHSEIQGKEIHAHLTKVCLRPCLFLQNNLLNMYCKCGDIASAQKVFDLISEKDAVSWNSLICGYFQTGLHKYPLIIFREALYAHAKLDHYTYSCVIKVCSKLGDFNLAKAIHGMVVINGYHQLTFLVSSLINMYSRYGAFNEARHVFENSNELDDVSWNSIISASVQAGSPEDALKFFTQMHRSGRKLNPFALGSVLKSCSSINNSVAGRVIHGCSIKVGLDSDVFFGSGMVDLYAKSNLLEEAKKVFKYVTNPSIVVFNSMIAGLCQVERDATKKLADEALNLFSVLQRSGIKPSNVTFSSVLTACKLANDFEFGKVIHGLVLKNNLQHDNFIGSALIELYSNSGHLGEGLRCFYSLPKKDIVTWTSMVSGCVQTGNFEMALSSFHLLFSTGLKPDQFTLSSLMCACANLALSRSGEQIQCYVMKTGFSWFTAICNSQIFMYARSGDVKAASQTFLEMKSHDVISWSAVISSHAQHGNARDALMFFEEMRNSSVKPNHVTFLGVLTACSHGGLVDEGFRYYASMRKDYNVEPNVKHCSCMVDLLGRAGRITEAENFILDSNFYDDPIIWRALLGSCRVHKDMETGTRAAKRVMELEPSGSASYVLLYNLYLDLGKKSLALKTRDLMKERGVKKEPGLSWIEIGGTVHSFVVGDNSHPESKAIYTKLEEMLLKIEKMGYIRQSSSETNNTSSENPQTALLHHSEKLAVAMGMIHLPSLAPIRVMKNLRVCSDCHNVMKLFSKSESREIVLRDCIRFHHFVNGMCSCGDYW